MTADDYKSMFTGGKPVDLERKMKEEKDKEIEKQKLIEQAQELNDKNKPNIKDS